MSMWLRKLIDYVTYKFDAGVLISGNDPDFSKEKVKREFFELVEMAHVFVLGPFDDVPDRTLGPELRGRVEEVDLPFQTCVFECVGDRALFSGRNETGEQEYIMTCLLAHEYSPGSYRFWSYELHNPGQTIKIGCWREDPSMDREGVGTITSKLNVLLRSFLNARFVYEHTKERVKLGKGPDRKTHTISKIIRVTSKRGIVKPYLGGKLDFSHRFEVRGHWREINGIGKNRDGEYCINGYTWVIPHEKGPQGLPLVKKVRVVAGGVRIERT